MILSFSLILRLTLAEMYANVFILCKMKGKVMHYAGLAKKESLALAKSKAVDLLPCYCI